MTDLECVLCGGSFTRPNAIGRNPRYCSDECRKYVAAASSAQRTAEYYSRHHERINRTRAESRAALRAEVARLKEAEPCADCGGYFPAVCMDYDHTGTGKVAGVGRLVSANVPMDKIHAEIAKCDLVCANCHRIRTEHRRIHDRESGPSQTS